MLQKQSQHQQQTQQQLAKQIRQQLQAKCFLASRRGKVQSMLQAILGHNKKKSRIAFKISRGGAARETGGTTFATTVRIGSSCECLTLPLSLTLSASLSLLLCNWFYSSEGGVQTQSQSRLVVVAASLRFALPHFKRACYTLRRL